MADQTQQLLDRAQQLERARRSELYQSDPIGSIGLNADKAPLPINPLKFDRPELDEMIKRGKDAVEEANKRIERGVEATLGVAEEVALPIAEITGETVGAVAAQRWARPLGKVSRLIPPAVGAVGAGIGAVAPGYTLRGADALGLIDVSNRLGEYWKTDNMATIAGQAAVVDGILGLGGEAIKGGKKELVYRISKWLELSGRSRRLARVALSKGVELVPANFAAFDEKWPSYVNQVSAVVLGLMRPVRQQLAKQQGQLFDAVTSLRLDNMAPAMNLRLRAGWTAKGNFSHVAGHYANNLNRRYERDLVEFAREKKFRFKPSNTLADALIDLRHLVHERGPLIPETIMVKGEAIETGRLIHRRANLGSVSGIYDNLLSQMFLDRNAVEELIQAGRMNPLPGETMDQARTRFKKELEPFMISQDLDDLNDLATQLTAVTSDVLKKHPEEQGIKMALEKLHDSVRLDMRSPVGKRTQDELKRGLKENPDIETYLRTYDDLDQEFNAILTNYDEVMAPWVRMVKEGAFRVGVAPGTAKSRLEQAFTEFFHFEPGGLDEKAVSQIFTASGRSPKERMETMRVLVSNHMRDLFDRSLTGGAAVVRLGRKGRVEYDTDSINAALSLRSQDKGTTGDRAFRKALQLSGLKHSDVMDMVAIMEVAASKKVRESLPNPAKLVTRRLTLGGWKSVVGMVTMGAAMYGGSIAGGQEGTIGVTAAALLYMSGRTWARIMASPSIMRTTKMNLDQEVRGQESAANILRWANAMSQLALEGGMTEREIMVWKSVGAAALETLRIEGKLKPHHLKSADNFSIYSVLNEEEGAERESLIPPLYQDRPQAALPPPPVQGPAFQPTARQQARFGLGLNPQTARPMRPPPTPLSQRNFSLADFGIGAPVTSAAGGRDATGRRRP